jgi:hypothetical protein
MRLRDDVHSFDGIDDWLKSLTELYHHVWRWRWYLPPPSLSIVIRQGEADKGSRLVAELDLPSVNGLPSNPLLKEARERTQAWRRKFGYPYGF